MGQHLIYVKSAQVTLRPGDGKVRTLPLSQDYHHDCSDDDDDGHDDSDRVCGDGGGWRLR